MWIFIKVLGHNFFCFFSSTCFHLNRASVMQISNVANMIMDFQYLADPKINKKLKIGKLFIGWQCPLTLGGVIQTSVHFGRLVIFLRKHFKAVLEKT